MAKRKVKGHREWEKFARGERLTHKEAILAFCYTCNGMEEEGGTDCHGHTCPLYSFMPYARKVGKKGQNRMRTRKRAEARKITPDNP